MAVCEAAEITKLESADKLAKSGTRAEGTASSPWVWLGQRGPRGVEYSMRSHGPDFVAQSSHLICRVH